MRQPDKKMPPTKALDQTSPPVYKHVEMAHQYARDILMGIIPACRWVKAACQRHLDDIERSSKGWHYRFDQQLASRKCKFIELLPHTKGEWATRRERIVLQPWQAFIICSVFGWVDKDGMRRYRTVYIECPRKNSKAEWIENLIPTPDGFRKMADIQPGDMVLGSDGMPIAVRAVTEVMHNRDCLEVNFSTGEQIVVAADHLWEVGDRMYRTNTGRIGYSVLRTDELQRTLTFGAKEYLRYSVGTDKRSITAIKEIASVPVKCIEVDALDGLYLTSRSFIPTHNSTLSAGVGLVMMADDKEHGAEIYSGATTEKQAWEVFRPAKLMATGTPSMLAHYGMNVNAKTITILKNGSRFEPVIGKPGDGSSPSMAIIDEFHEHLDPAQRDTMQTGMGARRQPLLWIITTAGDNIAGPCYDERLTMQTVLDKVVEDDTRFGIIYTIDEGDDWTKPGALIKANPNYGISVSSQFLESQQRDAVRNSRMQGVFKTKHLNIWVQSRAQSFNMEKWNSLYDPTLTMDDFKGHRAWIGLDLASEVDIAALEIIVEDGNGGYVEFNYFYLPEETVNDPKKNHYKAWESDGYVTVTDGAMIDFQKIEEDILKLCEHFTNVEVAYDPFQATYLITRLMEAGISVIKYPQQVGTMSPAMKRLDALIMSAQLRHGNSERHPMTWMMANVVSKTDAKDNVYPRKERKENAIDGPVALMMAIGRCITGETATSGSIYDDPKAYAEAFGRIDPPAPDAVVVEQDDEPWSPPIMKDVNKQLFAENKKRFEEWVDTRPDNDP